MNISPLNIGIDLVRQDVDPLVDADFPSQKALPPDGQAVVDHVAQLHPGSKVERLLERFARPDHSESTLNAPSVSGRVFESLMLRLAEAPPGSSSAEAFQLLQEQKRDWLYLKANLKNLVHA